RRPPRRRSGRSRWSSRRPPSRADPPPGGIGAQVYCGSRGRTCERGPHRSAGPSRKPCVRAYGSTRYGSGRNDDLRLRALLALGDDEGHLLAFLELAEARGGDVRVVGEDVSAAAVLLDEAEALFRVEPLHRTGGHIKSPETVPGKRTLRIPSSSR